MDLEETISTVETIESTTAQQASNGIDWNHVWQVVVEWCVNTGIKIILAIIILIISFKIINLISKRITKRLERKNADATLSRVLVNVTRLSLKILIVFRV